jgi:hypothetical protein
MCRWSRITGVIALTAVLGLTGCGDSSSQATDVVQAGQLDIKLPPGWKVTAAGIERPAPAPSATPAPTAAPAAAGASALPTTTVVGATATTGGPSGATSTTSADTTIPLVKEDSTTAFFKATTAFSQCLKDNGTKFVGAPDAKNPSSPANDPNYIKSLTTCAAKSNIVQALKDASAAQKNQTPAEIQKSNEGFLAWRDCMIGLGWDIAKPKPDKDGRLFSISGGGASVQITPPPGKDILSSSDTQNCAAQAQRTTGAGG